MPEDPLYRWGRWVVRHQWWVVAFWVLLVTAGAFLGPKVDSILQGATTVAGSQTSMVSEILRKDFGNRFGNELVVVFHSRDKSADEIEFQEAVEKIQLGLRDSLRVNSVITYYDTNSADLISRDQQSVLGYLELDVPDTYAAQKAVPELREIVAQAGVPAWMETYLVGQGAIFHDLSYASSNDVIKAETHAFPVVILILLFTFGALLASGVPVVLGVVSVAITMGAVFLLGHHFPMFIVAKNAISMIGLGVGIDYSLFMVSRLGRSCAGGSRLRKPRLPS